jgi:hypothetical protein
MAKMTLDDLVTQLSAVYGQELVSVALYGSAARGERVERHSDVNVFVVVERVTMEHLRREGAIAAAWRDAGNPPPLTLTRAEWVGSADIFPIEYGDILAHHKVLKGSLPLEGIRVDHEHLRLQLEHEAMSKLLRLRHTVLTAAGAEKILLEMLEGSSKALLTLLRATLRLVGDEPAADSELLCAQARDRLGLETSPVLRVIRHLRGKEKLTPRDAAAHVESYLGLAAGLVDYLDRYSHS